MPQGQRRGPVLSQPADTAHVDAALRRYFDAVASRSAERIVEAFCSDGVVEHATGTYQGAEAIERFYRQHNLGAEKVQVSELGRWYGRAGAAVELRLDLDGDVQHLVDLFDVTPEARISRLSIYRRG